MLTIFTGPSLSPLEINLPHAEVLPPVGRGDLHAARERGAGLILIIDGVFSHQLAVSPREVVDVLEDGATVFGASSMGAIRAAECWPAGMQGIGSVYRMYRTGVLESDDFVAVTTDPDRAHAAVSVALINVFAAMRRTRHKAARQIEAAASEMFFAQRTWRAIFHQAGIADPALQAFCESVDIKRADALRAVSVVSGLSVPSRPPRGPFNRPIRYPGHDPLLGMSIQDAENTLLRWLFGSGRYQRYIWPVVAGSPMFKDVNDPGELRERLVLVLAEMLDDPADLTARLCEELRFTEEFESELMHWYAVSQLAASKSVPLHVLTAARERVAITHGYSDWRCLVDDLEDGKLFGAIPLEWVEQASLAMAKANS